MSDFDASEIVASFFRLKDYCEILPRSVRNFLAYLTDRQTDRRKWKHYIFSFGWSKTKTGL